MIKNVTPLVIYTSTSRPTVELTVVTTSGRTTRAALPLGYDDLNSDPLHIHLEVLDVLKVLITPLFLKKEIDNQREFDQELSEATEHLQSQRLKAKVRYLASIAYAKSCAADKGVHLHEYISKIANCDIPRQLPVPMSTILSGGRVSSSPLKVQAVMLVPIGINSLPNGIRAAAEISATLLQTFKANGKFYGIGDEGGLSTDFDGCNNEEILDNVLKTVVDAIRDARYEPDEEIQIALDFGANYSRVGHETYTLVTEKEKISSKQVIELCKTMCKKYPIFMIEDPLSVDDMGDLKDLHEHLSGKTLIAADDLIVDQSLGASKESPWDARVIMPDRIGTLFQSFEMVAATRAAGYIPIASHRSSETEDVFISDFTAALAIPYIKAGGMSGSERTGKYNQLLRISELYKELRPVLTS